MATLHEWIGSNVEVKPGKRMRKDVYVVAVDHVDRSFTGSQRRFLRETPLGQRRRASVLRETLLEAFQADVPKPYRENSTRRDGTINPAMHLIYIDFQCSGVGEWDKGLTQVEEVMLDASAAYGADPIPLRERAQ